MTRFFRLPDGIPLGVRIVQCIGTIMSLLHFVVLLFSSYPTATPDAVAAFLYVASFILFWSAIHVHSSRPPAACCTPDLPAQLIVFSPHHWARHPFYTAYMLAWLASAFATYQPWLSFSLVPTSILYIRAAHDEEHIFQWNALAPDFEHYCNKTGMFSPEPIETAQPNVA